MKSYSLIIPHAARNNGLLERNMPFIRQNISTDRIFILTSKRNFSVLSHLVSDNVELVDEDTVYPGMTFAEIQKLITAIGLPETRTGWYFQQFLKMAWALHEKATEWYAVWDSDTFPLHPIHFFNQDGRAIFTRRAVTSKKEVYNRAYYDCMLNLAGIEKLADFSFIAEYMIFNREIMSKLIELILQNDNMNSGNFFSVIINTAAKTDNPYTGFSEFETYGNFVLSRYADRYTIKNSTTFRLGARYFGLKPNRFDLARMKRKYTTVSFERWDHIIPPFIWLQKCISLLMYPFTGVRP